MSCVKLYMVVLLISSFLLIEVWSKDCRLSDKNITDEELSIALERCDNDTELINLKRNSLHLFNPVLFRRFHKLKFLFLDENNIQNFPKNMSKNLFSLKHLTLTKNNIEHIPQNLDLPNLTDLDLSRNNITYLAPHSFARMHGLKTLYLSRNKLHKVTIDAFTGLTSLQRLFLDHNEIDVLYAGVLNGLVSLQKFNVAHNQLQRVRKGVMNNFRYLTDIILKDNFISTLDDRSFQGLKIHVLDLQNNRLKAIRNNVFSSLVIFGKINMKGNPLVCDCWLMHRNIIDLRMKGELQGDCATPSRLKGRNIRQLSKIHLPLCKTYDSCKDHLCQNEATCLQVNETVYKCECLKGFYGDQCEKARQDTEYTLLIILSVCLGVVITIGVIVAFIIRARKNRNVHGRCVSKETCCCFMILGVFFFLFALFVGLRVACKFHEYC
ncbi:nephrocan-like [Clytia hemisphaerica]|uniref:EGF-like domain-containing protein n=1 Tax=Clytia hemisphaerica TaxID=252671 RepID=A0A7M5V397_9CNID